MLELYKKCNLCPRNCLVDRTKTLGYCKATDKVKVARSALHYFEEPSISGSNGSGTIFFSNCNLKCCYCQNKEISTDGFGKEITIERLSEMMLELEEKHANNINLVTPTHYVPSIIEAIKLARKKGLSIPIVYNTSGYESVETLKLLEGYIDIYLTDFKYFDNKLGKYLSKCSNYFEVASKALEEMYRQTGKNIFNKDGLMTKGIIVRCLVLPTKSYTPVNFIKDYPYLNKTISEDEYNDVIDYAIDLGIKNAYMQEGGTCSESFIPAFDLEGV